MAPRALDGVELAKKETPGPTANQPRTSLHYEANLKAGSKRIYELLLDSKQFAALTGRPAEIDPKEGGAFTMFGALIVGRNVELIANQANRPGMAIYPLGSGNLLDREIRIPGTGTFDEVKRVKWLQSYIVMLSSVATTRTT